MNTSEITQYTSLAAAEAAIVQAQQSAWLQMGQAFRAIYEGRLWETARRADGTPLYADFQTYLRDKWRISEEYARKLIRASGVTAQLVTIVPNCESLPAHYSQAFALADFTPETQQITWTLIIGTTPENNRTARYIKAVAETVDTMLRTGALEIGDGQMHSVRAIAESAAPSVTEAAYEAMQRQREYLRADRPAPLLNETFLNLEEAAARLGNMSHAGEVRVVVYPVEVKK